MKIRAKERGSRVNTFNATNIIFPSGNSEADKGVYLYTAHCYLWWINIFARYTSLCLYPRLLSPSSGITCVSDFVSTTRRRKNARYADIKVFLF